MNPLSGIRIAVTRAASQARELAAPLESAGALVHVCPLIKIQPRAIDDVVQRVLRELNTFEWVVFTSPNGVRQFMELLRGRGAVAEQLAGKRIAAVGPGTAAELASYGVTVTAMPGVFLGEAVAASMLEHGPVSGQKILLARAGGGGAELPAQLRENGARVEDLELYRSVPDAEGAQRLKALIRTRQIDMVTFTSGSAVTYFVESVGTKDLPAVAAIGPSTAAVARRLGVQVDVEADPHTIPGLVASILGYYAARSGSWRSDAGK